MPGFLYPYCGDHVGDNRWSSHMATSLSVLHMGNCLCLLHASQHRRQYWWWLQVMRYEILLSRRPISLCMQHGEVLSLVSVHVTKGRLCWSTVTLPWLGMLALCCLPKIAYAHGIHIRLSSLTLQKQSKFFLVKNKVKIYLVLIVTNMVYTPGPLKCSHNFTILEPGL